MSYDFSELNDKEFEALTCDLLSSYLNKRIERFKPGKDKGVDGRFFEAKNEECVIQCKHYLGSGFPKLIQKLKKEVEKVTKLNPSRYIFVTSLPLSRENKKTISNLFNTYLNQDDIFGQEDLNDLLKNHPEIEKRYYKLWIKNTHVLQRILHNGITSRSKDLLTEIVQKAVKYAETSSYKQAIEKLKEKRVLIITGEPGAGKTTLAENVALYYVAAQKYEFIDIQNSVNEAEALWDIEKKQLFYYDDFLGSNFFEAIEHKKDSHIVGFINRISKTKDKLFILTSRTIILNAGIKCSDTLKNANIQKNEYTLKISTLSEYEKGLILYNQMWHSQLKPEYIDQIYFDKRYKAIVNHENFNPRLIEFILDSNRLENISSTQYWKHILDCLNNPRDIWKNCFEEQTNDYVRYLVLLTVFNGIQITDQHLQKAYESLIQLDPPKYTSHSENNFNSMTPLATQAFLNRIKIGDKISYTVINPSLTDFIIENYRYSSPDKLLNIYKALGTLSSLEYLVNLRESNLFETSTCNYILDSLFEAYYPQKSMDSQLIFLASQIERNDSRITKINHIVERIINEPVEIMHFKLFWNFLCLQNIFLTDYSFLKSVIGKHILDLDEINDILTHYRELLFPDESLKSIIVTQLESYLYNNVYDIAYDIDLKEYLDYSPDESECSVSDLFTDRVVEELSSLLASLNLEDEIDSSIDWHSIAREVGTDGLLRNHFSDGDYKGLGLSTPSNSRDLDELFQRG